MELKYRLEVTTSIILLLLEIIAKHFGDSFSINKDCHGGMNAHSNVRSVFHDHMVIYGFNHFLLIVLYLKS